jgi:hypothetical protein
VTFHPATALESDESRADSLSLTHESLWEYIKG